MKTKKGISFLGKILLFFNSLAILALFIVYISARVNPSVFWPIALPGLVYHFILIINIGFVLLWIVRRRLFFLFSLLAILLGYSHVLNLVSFSSTSKPLPQSGKNLHVLSYNVRVFDLYNYKPNWQLNFTQRNNIFRFLEEEDFDIICFQEFVHDASKAFKTLDTIPLFLNARYTHAEFTRSSKNINFFGLATFSRYPIVNKGVIDFPNHSGNHCIYSDIKIGADTIRVYNVHFASIGLSSEDFLFVENMINVDQIPERNYFRRGSLRILRRLRDAYQQRGVQANLVAQHIDQSPFPVILAGDFNDTPASYAYRLFSQRLNDAFHSGKGTGQTYRWFLPGFRIDYILHSDEFTPYNFRTGRQEYSDHFPVSVWLNFDKNEH